MHARAVLFTGVNEVTVDTVEIPEPAPHDLLIEAAYTCISPGTELRCLAGKQQGSPGWPAIPGYALAGTVVARGSAASTPIGARVLCSGTVHANRNLLWGGHISHAIRPESQVFMVPDEVDLLDAAVARLAAIAYHGLRLARPLPHERVAVVGLGPIGMLSARLYAATGALVVGLDRTPERVAACRDGGVAAVVADGDLRAAAAPVLPDGADIVVDATGSAAVAAQSVTLARSLGWDDVPMPGARFVVQGSYPDAIVLPYQESFVNELTVLIPRDAQPRDLRTVLDLLARRRLVVNDIVSTVQPPEEAPAIYAALRAGDRSLLTVAFRWA